MKNAQKYLPWLLLLIGAGVAFYFLYLKPKAAAVAETPAPAKTLQERVASGEVVISKPVNNNATKTKVIARA